MASVEVDNLVVFYNVSTSVIWPDKNSGFSLKGLYKKGGLSWKEL